MTPTRVLIGTTETGQPRCLTRQPIAEGGWYCSEPQAHDDDHAARLGHAPDAPEMARWAR